MAPGIRVVQCVEYLNIIGGRNAEADAMRMIRFLPSLSEIIPPGSCTRRVVRDVIVVSNPMLPFVPPSSRI